jgi:hypothetical protein
MCTDVSLSARGLIFNSQPQVQRNGDFMKNAERLTYMLVSFAMFFATTAFAANKGHLQVPSATMVGETQLPAGEYTVQWEGTGPDVELKIKQDNKVKIIVPARVMPLDRPFRTDAMLLDTEGDGSRKLREIRFSGKKFCLQIEPQSAEMKVGAGK